MWRLVFGFISILRKLRHGEGKVVRAQAVLRLLNPVSFHLTQQAGLDFILYRGTPYREYLCYVPQIPKLPWKPSKISYLPVSSEAKKVVCDSFRERERPRIYYTGLWRSKFRIRCVE